MAICANCGHEAVVEFKFCPECGAATAGGTVEKFIGDAVVAVFGVPTVHEDDALRACRAAMEMRDALPELGVGCRIGVNTGEVVTATDESLVTGDAVNVAARLEQAAQTGEVLIGVETLRLVTSAVEVRRERELELKGKAEPVAAYPLVAVTGELERRFASPMVGRSRELRRLRDAFSQAAHDRSCQLFTVLGSAGVGKSRLAAEFLSSVDASVFRGRCLSYGEGITYWPVVEVIKQLGSLPDGDAARPLGSLLGETNESASAAEIAWGFRKLLEQRAQDRPVVCVLDDLHWAEETLLDLVEHIADLSRDAPLLLLCMARPELLERRPSWGGGKWNATSVLLEPLDAEETEQLLVELGGVDSELHARIVQVAEGNPLFLEEMLALVRDSPTATIEVPPTIQALLAARLDQLDPAERAVLEHGSVEGRLFHRGAVAAMTDGDGQVDQRLLSLVRKELVRPDRPQFAGDDAYRFRHLLIRDAAYDAMPKSVRADLHRRFAAWLEQHGQDLVELDEILGYHLEQAARYLVELGRPDPALAEVASMRLAAAGRRARFRVDRDAARSLLGRAVALVDEPDLHTEIAYATLHPPLEGALLLDDLALRAEGRGDATGAALARARAAYSRGWAGKGSVAEEEKLVLEALSLLEARDDYVGLAETWFPLAYGVYNALCRYGEMVEAAERARSYEELAGMPHRSNHPLAVGLLRGPFPVDVALQRVDQLVDNDVTIAFSRAILLAMGGRIEEARDVARVADEYGRELGWNADSEIGEIESLAGNHEAAVERFARWCDFLEAGDEMAPLATYAAILGRELCALGRYDEAAQRVALARERKVEDDPVAAGLWRQVAALVGVHRGDRDEAEQLAREAVAFANETDSPEYHGTALFDLGRVLEAAGRPEEAAAAYRDALGRFEAKQIIPLARRARERLATL